MYINVLVFKQRKWWAESSNSKGNMKDKTHAAVGVLKVRRGKWKVFPRQKLQMQKLTRGNRMSVNLLEDHQEIKSLL